MRWHHQMSVPPVSSYCHAENIKIVPRGAGTSLAAAPCSSPTRWPWSSSWRHCCSLQLPQTR